jgi:hypothetical protein
MLLFHGETSVAPRLGPRSTTERGPWTTSTSRNLLPPGDSGLASRPRRTESSGETLVSG